MSIAYSCPEDSCKDEAIFPESQAGVEILSICLLYFVYCCLEGHILPV